MLGAVSYTITDREIEFWLIPLLGVLIKLHLTRGSDGWKVASCTCLGFTLSEPSLVLQQVGLASSYGGLRTTFQETEGKHQDLLRPKVGI